MHIPNTFLDFIQFDLDNIAELGRVKLIDPDYR